MTLLSNNPAWWPAIVFYRSYSYFSGSRRANQTISVIFRSNLSFCFAVAASTAVVYDWVLTLGQEVELVWRKRWSLMTVLYLGIRYIGIVLYIVVYIMGSLPTVSLTDAGCSIADQAINWTSVAIPAVLGVILIARLHAMYQASRKMLIFLIVSFLIINVACGVLVAMSFRGVEGEEIILSGTYVCSYGIEGNGYFLAVMFWMLNTVWEVLALCLALWIAVKHLRDLRRLGTSTGSTIGDCFTVLIKSHALYFANFAAVACLRFGYYLSPTILDNWEVDNEIYYGAIQIFSNVQMFVLGPRLILSVREYHAKLVANSDTGTGMTSIVFQERLHASTSSTV